MAEHCHLILSQGRKVSSSGKEISANRLFEERLLRVLRGEKGLAVAVVPHLVDLRAEGPAIEWLRSLQGHCIVLAWIPARACYWLLHRAGVAGTSGEAADLSPPASIDAAKPSVAPGDQRRRIWCLDLRKYPAPEACAEAVARILSDVGAQTTTCGKSADATANEIDEPTATRWYPVIDYDRCANCLECLNFCLFGVYGLDASESVFVEQPDACRPGCPACARVCPQGAIMFPEHADPTISGDASDRSVDPADDVSRRLAVLDPLPPSVTRRIPTSRGNVAPVPSDPISHQKGPPAQGSRLDDLIEELDDLDL